MKEAVDPRSATYSIVASPRPFETLRTRLSFLEMLVAFVWTPRLRDKQSVETTVLGITWST
jgi:hypothetical protein